MLLLVDISYSSRFWTQYEAWLSMQEASLEGLRGALPGKRRSTIVCLWNAQFKYEGQKLIEMWANKSPEQATRIMLHVHQKGVGVCGVYTFEVAETKVAQVMDLARRNEHPLQCTMEKED